MHLKAQSQSEGFGRLERLVKGPRIVSIQVVLEDVDFLSYGKLLGDMMHEHGIVLFGTPFTNLDKTATDSRFKGEKDRADTIALVAVIFPLGLAWLKGQWHQHIFDQLTRAFVRQIRGRVGS